MSGKITISLVVAFLLALFSIFNTELMDINLFSVKVVSVPKSLLVFFVFLTGAVYAGFLAFFEQLHSTLTQPDGSNICQIFGYFTLDTR